MGITHIPQQVASTVQDAADSLKYQGNRLLDQGWDKNWVRTVAAGSLVTGAVLLASGKRKAGLAVAAAGTVFALLEDPEGVKKVWNNIPDYLDNGHSMLSRFEKFVGELTARARSCARWSKKSCASVAPSRYPVVRGPSG